jgi:acetyl esterase/lipase
MKPPSRPDARARGGALAALSAGLLILWACAAHSAAPPPSPPPETLRLWPGAAPGTESWTGPEEEADADIPRVGKIHVVTNVTIPTVTVFRPPAGRASGTAMLVIPGGAFRALAWDLDGVEVARWLAARGITAFVLRYRVRPPGASAPPGAETLDAFLVRTRAARDIAVADAQQALRLIRSGAARYAIRPDRVGAIGASAGAMTVVDLALAPDAAARPDFAVAASGAIPPEAGPADGAPPLFIVAAQDDPQVPSARSVAIYERWTRAGRPAELHLYEKGGHGFGMRTRKQPADQWPAALEAWLLARDLVTPDFEPVPSASRRHDGWTPERQRLFIEALSKIGMVSAAARAVGMSRKSAYALLERAGPESGFARAWRVAQRSGKDTAFAAAIERAVDGVEVPYYYRGKLCGSRRAYDDRLLIAALNARQRERPGGRS